MTTRRELGIAGAGLLLAACGASLAFSAGQREAQRVAEEREADRLRITPACARLVDGDRRVVLMVGADSIGVQEGEPDAMRDVVLQTARASRP